MESEQPQKQNNIGKRIDRYIRSLSFHPRISIPTEKILHTFWTEVASQYPPELANQFSRDIDIIAYCEISDNSIPEDINTRIKRLSNAMAQVFCASSNESTIHLWASSYFHYLSHLLISGYNKHYPYVSTGEHITNYDAMMFISGIRIVNILLGINPILNRLLFRIENPSPSTTSSSSTSRT